MAFHSKARTKIEEGDVIGEEDERIYRQTAASFALDQPARTFSPYEVGSHPPS
jgi:hypothetical protein